MEGGRFQRSAFALVGRGRRQDQVDDHGTPDRPHGDQVHEHRPGTVAGGLITLAGNPPGAVVKAGSFASPYPPNTVQLVTNLPPVTACPGATSPHRAFKIGSGTISV